MDKQGKGTILSGTYTVVHDSSSSALYARALQSAMQSRLILLSSFAQRFIQARLTLKLFCWRDAPGAKACQCGFTTNSLVSGLQP